MSRRCNGLVTNNRRRVVFGGMKRERGFDGMRLVQEVALHVLVFVFDTEELEDDSAPAVGMKRSDEGLMAAAVQPDHGGFAGRPQERGDRKGRVAFFADQVCGPESLGLGQKLPD